MSTRRRQRAREKKHRYDQLWYMTGDVYGCVFVVCRWSWNPLVYRICCTQRMLAYWIILNNHIGIFWYLISCDWKNMQDYAFMIFYALLPFRITWHHDMTVHHPLVGYLLMGVASRRPRGNKPPGRLCIGLISKILEHRGYLHLCTIYVLTMY